MPATDPSPWRRFLSVALPVFHSETRWKLWGGLALVIGCLLAMSGLNVFNNYVNRDFFTALEQKQPNRFALAAGIYLAVFAVSTAVVVLKQYTEERCGLLWRQWLTTYLFDKYLTDRAYLRVDRQEDVDNPDQRLTEDVKTFTATTLSFGTILLNSALTMFAFLGVLWSITPWLVLTAIGYAIFGTLMTVLIGRKLVNLNFLQLKKEADLRYRLVQVRQQDELIALTRSEPSERGDVLRRLVAVVGNYLSIIKVNRNLGLFANGYNYVTQILPVLVVAHLYLRGDVPFGVVTQSAAAFTFVLAAFSVIVTEFQRVSSFAAVVSRLSSLLEASVEGTAPALAAAAPSTDGRAIRHSFGGDVVQFIGLTLVTPRDGQELIHELTLQVPPSLRLLVTGPNGAGKSALFKAAAGVWWWGRGEVSVPECARVMFLPHGAYAVPGTLRDQLLHGLPPECGDEAEIRRVLAEVKLDSAVEQVGGLDVERDWVKVLSKGQLQRLGLARVLLAKPCFALLDGATSALDSFWVQTLYNVLRETEIAYITFGDHPDLVPYHDLTLELCGDGSWRVEREPTGTCPVRPAGSDDE
jgi:putative ATP-binding cassette transporter